MKNQWFARLLASPLGTAIKTFICTVLTMWIAMDDLFAMDMHTLKALGSAGAISAVPVIINALNPQYPLYGVGRDIEAPAQPALGKKDAL